MQTRGGVLNEKSKKSKNKENISKKVLTTPFLVC
jgi:hypothetical protein